MASSSLQESKYDVVNYAKATWPLKVAYVFPVQKLAGIECKRSHGAVCIAIHNQGVSLLQGNDSKRLLQLSYSQLAGVEASR